MNYCEKCHYLLKEDSCYNCGNKKLRQPKDNDFCYFVDLQSSKAKMLESTLDNNKIEYAIIPIRLNAIGAKFAIDFDHRIYVFYKDLETVKELYGLLFNI